MRTRAAIAAVGVAVVIAYALLMVLVSLVFDPLAAAPGQSLAEIHAQLARYDMSVGAETSVVLVFGFIGVALAVVAGLIAVRTAVSPPMLTIIFLSIIGGGALGTFFTEVFVGLDLADAFADSAEFPSLGACALFLASSCSLAAIPLVAVGARRHRRSAAA